MAKPIKPPATKATRIRTIRTIDEKRLAFCGSGKEGMLDTGGVSILHTSLCCYVFASEYFIV
jgi:hypothetical protein